VSVRFDSLGYVRRLQQAGLDRDVAEAHADAVKDYLLEELATKRDLQDLEQRITIKLGTFLVIAVGAIVALERLLE
jgi:hypothetical protein